eukprot:4958712-Pyramimonas_sp.AAC.1
MYWQVISSLFARYLLHCSTKPRQRSAACLPLLQRRRYAYVVHERRVVAVTVPGVVGLLHRRGHHVVSFQNLPQSAPSIVFSSRPWAVDSRAVPELRPLAVLRDRLAHAVIEV